MKISVAMATYNGARFLREQLESLLLQTQKPDEVVISDDCSTDRTLEVLRSFQNTADFDVRIIANTTNEGYIANFGKAISACTGDLIFLCDQDDYWFSEKISTIVAIADENTGKCLIMCDALLTDGNLKPTQTTKIQQIRAVGLSLDSFVMGCCLAVRKEFRDLCLPIPHSYRGHDDWLVNIADELGCRYVQNIPLQYYRRHENNSSNFVANNAKRISKSDLFYAKLSHFDRPKKLSEINQKLIWKRMLLDGLIQFNMKSSGRLEFLSGVALDRCKLDLKILKKRREIVNANATKRLHFALKLYLSGGYRNFSGAKSFFKDIL